MDSQVDVSRRQFSKHGLAYGLAMGGQMESQVGSEAFTQVK